jgi:hypothetical protein
MQHKPLRWNSFPANRKIHHSLWKPKFISVHRSLATGPYPEPDESSLHPQMQHLKEYMCKCKRYNKKNDTNTRLKLACLTKACHLFINGKDVPAKQSLPSLYCRMKYHLTEESVKLIHRFFSNYTEIFRAFA